MLRLVLGLGVGGTLFPLFDSIMLPTIYYSTTIYQEVLMIIIYNKEIDQ
jgi:hypothetical protein